MKRKCAFLLLSLGLLSPGMAAALGLGELTLDSYLNEPLRAEVSLLETGELDPTQIRVRLAAREDFSRAGVERAYFLTSLSFEVVARQNDGLVLLVTSKDPVREPYLNFIVEARWPTGRLLREYTVLLDPPVFVGDQSGITARATAPRRGEPARPAPQRSEPAESEYEEQPPGSRMQQRSGYGSGALDTPVSGSEYFVQRNDTLWQIAEAGRPSGVSVQQTMLDILRMNPEAFIGNNINQLKAGYVLRLPSADEISPMSFEQAVDEVERQTQRWQDAAAGLDVRMDASEGLDMSGVSGSGSGEGHLQIAGVEDSDERGSGDISARMEDLDRTRRENQELSTRLDDMERQLETQERLISLKDEQIAALQQALEQAGEEPTIPDTSQEGTISELDAELETVEQAPAEPEVVEPAPAPAPEPEPRRAPPPEPEPTLLDMLMANIIYVGAGVVVLLLLLVLLLRNRLNFSMPAIGRKKSQDEQTYASSGGDDEDFADVSLSDDSLIVDEVDEDEAAPVEAPEPISSFSAPDEEAYAAQFESGDALAEADIYIAYGRFPQAVDLLKAAIAHEPANTDYRIKLMEACIEMVESAEFQQQYADLQVIGDDNVLQRARSLLEAVDGGEVWLDDLPPPSITPEDVAAAQAAASQAPEPELDLDLDIESAESDTAEELDGGLDLDEGVLDVDEEDDSGLDAAAGALDIDIEEPAGEDALADFDFEDAPADEGLDLELDEPEPEPEPEPAPTAEDFEELTLEGVAGDDGGDEFEDVDLPDLELETLDAEAEDDSEDEEFDLSGDDDELLAGLDELEMDLTGDSEPAPTPAPEPAPAPEPEPAVDDSMLDLDSELDGVDFDFGDDSDGGNLEDIELDMSADDGDDEGLMFATDGDEMATKLDLARAYIDMGDHDGARVILDEVVSGGNETQQQEARSLLEGID